MADFRETIRNYQPSKKVWFWSCAGIAVLTVIIGFTWGGWVTGGTASEMAQDRAEQARASLAASVCVERFLSAPDARANLASLKEESSFSRDDYLEDGGWVTIGDGDEPVDGAGNLCAEQLAEAELPPAEAPAPIVQEGDAGSDTAPVTSSDNEAQPQPS